jgi:diguanylate cyclase (GGDEF)-like protein
VLGLGSPLGWWAIGVLAGSDPVRVVTAHGALFAYLLAATVVAFAAFGAVLGHREDRLLEANRMLDALSVSDPVTGLRNSRYLRARLAEAHAHALRAGHAVSLIVLDLDRFKDVNDTWGHPTGDRVLVAVARALHEGVRGGDTTARLDGAAARMGGEEFAVLLEDTGLIAGVAVAERLLDAVRAVAVDTPQGPVRVTASAGLASTETCAGGPDELYAQADAAMYDAKHAGRDRLAVSGALLASRAGGPWTETGT